MKRVISLALCLVMVVCSLAVLASCGKDEEGAYSVAMITDYGDITDQSFNQTTHEACKAFCETNKIKYKYFKPANNNDASRIASVDLAVGEGYNVIVMPGFAFANTIKDVAPRYSDVHFIALDCGAGDFGNDYKMPSNVTSFVYQEELAGFMAGYGAVKEGYKKLGFLGGIAVPAVIRFGYGFVQGANKAAEEMNIADAVSVEYVYGGQFSGDPAITAVMDTWYGEKGVEVVFACGGGIYTSACEAAKKVGKKVIGVDVDQSAIMNSTYGNGICITSAMKGLAATVNTALTDLILNDGKNWNTDYAGKITNMGLVSGTDPKLNYVQLPMDTWSMTTFTLNDYKALVKKLYDKEITVSGATDAMPTVTIAVTTYDNIK